MIVSVYVCRIVKSADKTSLDQQEWWFYAGYCWFGACLKACTQPLTTWP